MHYFPVSKLPLNTAGVFLLFPDFPTLAVVQGWILTSLRQEWTRLLDKELFRLLFYSLFHLLLQ